MKTEQIRSSSFEVTYNKERYDIGTFLTHHPGGINYLQPYQQKDVTKRMEETNHSKAALYLFKEYNKSGSREKATEVAHVPKDLERLVDWNKAMLHQVGNLGTQYKEWVILPVDRQMRLFENPLLESLTITPWYVVPMVWIPIIIYLIKLGAERYADITKDPAPSVAVFWQVMFGVALWTFLEYSLHRWVFHMMPTGRSKFLIYMHFAIHGLHHKVPFDTRRLVFPPLPAAVIALFLYQMVSFVVPESMIISIVSGALLGYVVYDMIHFYLHAGTPQENSYFYYLKRYHNQHHFAHQDSGFGISSVIWDKFFGTAIRLKHLSMAIKW